jgi:hypothetical protein
MVVVSNKKSKAQQAVRSTRDFHQSQTAKHGTDEDLRYQDDMSGPYSMLGQGRLDPFKLFPAENVPVLVQRLLDHGEHLWLYAQSHLPFRSLHSCHETSFRL